MITNNPPLRWETGIFFALLTLLQPSSVTWAKSVPFYSYLFVLVRSGDRNPDWTKVEMFLGIVKWNKLMKCKALL